MDSTVWILFTQTAEQMIKWSYDTIICFVKSSACHMSILLGCLVFLHDSAIQKAHVEECLRDSKANLSQNVLCILRLLFSTLFSTLIIFEISTQNENPVTEFDTATMKIFTHLCQGFP